MAADRVPALRVCHQRADGVATVTVQGEIDVTTVSTLSEYLGGVARANPARLVIDLSQVSFLDSSGLVAFVRVRKALPVGCPVVIRSPQRRVREVFKLTGLDSVLVVE